MKLAKLTPRLARILFLAWMLLGSTFLFSQERKISGKVTNSIGGQPIPGATINIKGSKVATISDQEGTFAITVPNDKATLIITSVGFDLTEISVSGKNFLEIALKEKPGALDEVIVTGYATQKKRDLTGSVAVVDVADMVKQPTADVPNLLQGRAAGVNVISSGSPGEAPQIRIRGTNTFGNNSPLYVVDGVPTENINDINPNDIGSIQVLKDAGAASIYGSRASNGVLIITTKKGKGKIRVSYDGYYGVQVPKSGNVWDILSPQEMAEVKWKALANTFYSLYPDSTMSYSDGLYGTGAAPVLPDYIAPAGLKEGDPGVDQSKYNVNPNYTSSDEYATFYRISKANKAGTDWYHEIFKNAPITSHNISVSGGGDQGNYLMSFNYFNQQGTLIKTYNKRYTIRSNAQYNVTKNIRVGENLSYSVIDNPRITILSEGNAVSMAYRQQPIVPVHDIMGNYAGSFSTNGAQLGQAVNAVAQRERTTNNKGLGYRLFGNVFAEIDLFKDFTVRSSFGGENYSFRGRWFNYPTYENAENSNSNSYSENGGTGYNWTWTNTITYHHTFGSHDIKVVAGTEAYNNTGNYFEGNTKDYFSFDPNYTTLGTGASDPTHTSSRYADALTSLIGRIDYSYMGKYLLSGTIRRDGSSKFLNHTYGVFPAISAGWRISDENFMKSITWLTDLKIRGSWGIMGNQFNVSSGNSFTTYDSDKGSSFYDINGTSNSIVQGFRQLQIGNPDAKWESDINANIGFDAVFFNGKLDLTVDYYRKDINDLLFNPNLPGTAGAAGVPYVNAAQMKNAGFDISAGSHFDVGTDWKFDLTANFTTNKNEILRVSDGIDYFDGQSRRFNGSAIIRNQVGHPVSSFYGYEIVGFWDSQEEIDAANIEAQKATNNPDAVFQTDAGIGRFRYNDFGKGIVTPASRTFLGNPVPKFTYGLNIGVSYKQFDLSAFFYGVSGNKIWNQVRWWTDFYPSFGGGLSKTAMYDSWTPDHQDAKAPILENSGNFSNTSVPNSYFVEDGSYFRLKNMQIGYTLPASLLEKAGISRVRIYVQGANLFTITKYTGIDPEVGVSQEGGDRRSVELGIDEGAYPSQKQFLFGLNVTF
ncbi:TonB-dependent receptor [Agriterribacter sp.]|uniref:SusC/RagA family TonB-linked outer membrane protein n=1 Tax=Agriterribacter sp. TaxID=2821509 RepID=UPI002B545C79|nr:TonB-dependent receptor [Agriterribacter sp.]HTN08305.1 TonB-dependent receptor [Agriterribacter sp.]